MSADWLRELAASATPGPWDYNLPAGLRIINRNDARLIALAPDLAELCAEQHEALAMLWQYYLLVINDEQKQQVENALARLTALQAAHTGEDSKATEGSK